jgi:hypothetical protein
VFEMAEFRVRQEGMVVAGSNSLAQALHYVRVYCEEGSDVELQIKSTSKARWKTIATYTRIKPVA